MSSLYDNLPKNSVIMMHSSLNSLGYKININDFIEKIISTIDDATLIMPAFNFDFAETGIFNSKNTKSNNGLLTEVFRLRDDIKRTNNPMQSLSIYGKNQNKYIASNCETTFGKDSIFDMMYNDDAYIVLLGVDYNKVTFYHYLEEKYNVPYRFWKTFNGYIEEGSNKKDISYKMFVRELEYLPNINHYGLLMEERNIVNKFTFHNSIVRIFKVRDLYDLLKKDLERDPYCMVNTHRDFWKISTSI